jgi:transposase-like protein
MGHKKDIQMRHHHRTSVVLGPDAKGLSATTVTRLETVWEQEHQEWSKRSLAGKEYVYVWADGVHFNIRLEGGRQCILVLMGGRRRDDRGFRLGLRISWPSACNRSCEWLDYLPRPTKPTIA